MFVGIQGFISQIDENGDGVGNFTLLARQPYSSNLSEFSMRPVGHFQMEIINKTIPVRIFVKVMHIILHDLTQ